jgi:lincosamide nucleotidyltransferase A/C/D/E
MRARTSVFKYRPSHRHHGGARNRLTARFGLPQDGFVSAASKMGRMKASDVVTVLDRLEQERIKVWLDGGWGIDALVGRETRPHEDLDLVVAQDDLPRAQAALADLGFEHDPSVEPGLPARLVLTAADARRVDVHLIVLDGRGDGWQPLGEGAWGAYPAEGLTGTGEVAGRSVQCITPELQLRHHLGYPPDANDRHDLRLIAERFDLGLPPGF